jgi:hypothetical protein
MTWRAEDGMRLARLTATDPRGGMRAVLTLGLPSGAAWAALALTAVVSSLLVHLGARMAPPPEGSAIYAVLLASPFRTAAIQAAGLVLSALVIHAVGRMFRGRGRIEDSVLAVALLQVFLIALQVAQLGALLVFPLLSGLIGLASMVVFLWLLTAFVAEVHGFRSLLAVLLGIVATVFVLSLLLSFVLVALVGQEVLGNV